MSYQAWTKNSQRLINRITSGTLASADSRWLINSLTSGTLASAKNYLQLAFTQSQQILFAMNPYCSFLNILHRYQDLE